MPGVSYQYLLTQDEKIKLFEQINIDYLYIIPFDIRISNLSAIDFLKSVLLHQLHCKHIVVGYDHHFGKNREGNYSFLAKNASAYQYSVEEIPPLHQKNQVIHSSTIKNMLLTGNIDEANAMLGKPYQISGVVVEGEKNGRKIGFPTANIDIGDHQKILPQNGVYAVKCTLNEKTHNAMLNIGIRPTVNGTKLSVEVHVFNFEANIYGQFLNIQFVKRLRDEIKFLSLNTLKDQLKIDRENALKVLS
jgi:riboflavin kinase/FMN adenylyltransferase